MNETSTQEFHRKALATAVATALVPSFAYGAAAGRVDFAYGDVKVKGEATAGAEKRLTKGATINQGDTIITARGRAQIRFSDGARTSLLPNTEFKVETYEFEEQAPEESKGFFSLLKGGLRTITGAIGRLRNDAYQVTTPVATIGIRGTEYLVVLGNSANLWVGAGTIVACNDGGCQRYENGESGYVASNTARPIVTDSKPDDSSGYEGEQYIASDDVDNDGTTSIFDVDRLNDGAFYSLAVSVGDSVEGAGNPPSPSDLVNATFINGVVLQTYSSDNLNGSIGSASFEGASDGTIGWGRWFSGTILTDADCCSIESVVLSGSASHHYAIGLATENMPTTSTGHYTLIGGTNPTYASPGGGIGTLNTSSVTNLNVDFMTSRVDVNIRFNIDGRNFVIDSMNTNIFNNRFNDFGQLTQAMGCMSGGCYTSIEGFFAGSGASRAGVVYTVEDDYAEDYINGSAAFAKTGPGTPIEIEF